MEPSDRIYTIGHSTLPVEHFVELLAQAGIQAVADVRSNPYSRRNPQFNRESLKYTFNTHGIANSYLGEELGGRPKAPQFYCDGIADYRRMRAAPAFETGLARLHTGMRNYRIAIMCAEQNPLHCHRCLLVGRALHEQGKAVAHLLHDGALVTQQDIEAELLRLFAKQDEDLFAPVEERIDAAYWAQNRSNAFTAPGTDRRK